MSKRVVFLFLIAGLCFGVYIYQDIELSKKNPQMANGYPQGFNVTYYTLNGLDIPSAREIVPRPNFCIFFIACVSTFAGTSAHLRDGETK
jgi:hypothetical protein